MSTAKAYGQSARQAQDAIALQMGTHLSGAVKENRIISDSAAVVNFGVLAKLLVDKAVFTAAELQAALDAAAADTYGDVPNVPLSEAWNTFNGGTQGTAVTEANSGGSGTAFDEVRLGATATATYDNTHARGAFACKLANPAAARRECCVVWRQAVGSEDVIWLRGYFYVTANPANTHVLLQATDDTEALVRGSVVLKTTGVLETWDAAGNTVQATSNTVALNQWIRVEAKIIGSAGTGQIQARLFNSADSDTPTESLSSGATVNTGGTMGAYQFGAAGIGLPAGASMWLDDLMVTNADWPGPTF